MDIRPFQPGDEVAQAAIFNTVASALPAFKPATVDEIVRRYRQIDPDPRSKRYAVRDGKVVGYAAFNANGRVSFPWCLPEAADAREPLLDALLGEMRARGLREAWVAYRADWQPVLEFFHRHGFRRSREMVNFLASTTDLPHVQVPDRDEIVPLDAEDMASVRSLGHGLLADLDPETLGRFFWENPFFTPASLFGLWDAGRESLRGVGLVITNAGYADPTKLDANMPCFRLGAFGTETQRHKRVNGLISLLFASESDGEVLLSEAARRLDRDGLSHASAQASSDQIEVCRLYERFFQRQGSFPILSRSLSA